MIIFAYLPYGLAEGIQLSGGFTQTHNVTDSLRTLSLGYLFTHTPSPSPSPPTGIMSILFAGIVMSHYSHHNLSPVTQILMQQTLRAVAFMCGQ